MKAVFVDQKTGHETVAPPSPGNLVDYALRVTVTNNTATTLASIQLTLPRQSAGWGGNHNFAATAHEPVCLPDVSRMARLGFRAVTCLFQDGLAPGKTVRMHVWTTSACPRGIAVPIWKTATSPSAPVPAGTYIVG